MAEIVLAKNEYMVNAGKQIAINAYLINVQGRGGKKRLLFVVDGENGEIDSGKGIFRAPITRENKKESVTISCLDDPTISPVNATINIIAAEVPKIVKSIPSLKVKSGKRLTISASLKGWIGVGEKPSLIYEITTGEGEIDNKGSFLAPLTMQDQSVEIRISCPEDLDVSPVSVSLTIEGAQPIYPRFISMRAGQEQQFKVKPEFGIIPRWEIKDLNRDMGNIIHDSGIYKAPEVIKDEKSITITMKDLNTGKEDSIGINLLPVRFEVGQQDSIYAGQEKAQLNILTRNDVSGLFNFDCLILFGPGEVEDGGTYFPPLRIDKKPTVVKVEAISKLDATKKISYEFELGFPLCPKCKSETDKKGRCVNCPPEKSYGKYFKEFKERMK